MKTTTNTKGFTLIELLVVVAIIGILATVVLASLSSARDKAKDASIKSILSNMRAQAELQYDGDFDNVCDPTSKSGIMFANAHAKSNFDSYDSYCLDQGRRVVYKNGEVYSNYIAYDAISAADANGSTWAARVYLHSEEHFCIDSLGVAIVTPTRTVDSTPDKTC
jgi:prepilin-type N-terminal cleavage/methylation domain-containing protein